MNNKNYEKINELYNLNFYNKQLNMIENPEFYFNKISLLKNEEGKLFIDRINNFTNNGNNDFLETMKNLYNFINKNEIDKKVNKKIETMLLLFSLNEPSNILIKNDDKIINPYLSYKLNNGKMCVFCNEIYFQNNNLKHFDSFRGGVDEKFDKFLKNCHISENYDSDFTL